MLTEKAVPVSWPVKCGEPIRLPPCGHFKQPRLDIFSLYGHFKQPSLDISHLYGHFEYG